MNMLRLIATGARDCASAVARVVTLLAVFLGLAGCSLLMSKPVSPPAFYTLDGGQFLAPGVPARVRDGPEAGLTLIIASTVASAGFDSPHLMYTREAHRLEYFAHSLWVDTPARMLTPLIAAAVTRDGVIRAAVLAEGVPSGELRLLTQIECLQQDFGVHPSRVRFTLRATLVDEETHRVLATREFDQVQEAASEDPYGGVVAANRAVATALLALAAFTNDVARDLGTARARAGRPR